MIILSTFRKVRKKATNDITNSMIPDINNVVSKINNKILKTNESTDLLSFDEFIKNK